MIPCRWSRPATALPPGKSPKRSYPNLAEQDTQYLPKTITENGKTLTLTDIQWQTDNTANLDGYAVADRYTAVATCSGRHQQLCEGYTVTADYAGTVSRIALNRVRYAAIFEGNAHPAHRACGDTHHGVRVPLVCLAHPHWDRGRGRRGRRRCAAGEAQKENADEEDTE